MDTQRLILFVIFSFSALFLWEAWQRDHRPPVPQATTAQPAPKAGIDAPLPAGAVAPAVPGSTTAVVPTGEKVVIKTDLFVANIDTLGGVDHTFVLRGAAKLSHPVSGRALEVRTSEPGLTVYTAYQFVPGGVHPRYGGVALETEHFPDSPNHPEFPRTLLMPDETFTSTTTFRFSITTDQDMPTESRLPTLS